MSGRAGPSVAESTHGEADGAHHWGVPELAAPRTR